MPPRKRARMTPSAGSPSVSTPAAASSPPASTNPKRSTPAPSSTHMTGPSDDWTADQTIDLFKAILRYKPAGIHKHFHMLSISSFLRSHGHCIMSSAANIEPLLAPHTRIPGIWEKLNSLYALESLDEIEDAHAIGSEDVLTEDWEADGELTMEFSLPSEAEDERFGELMWERRFPDVSDVGTSPPALSFTRGRDGSLVEWEDEDGGERMAVRKSTGGRNATKAAAATLVAKQGRGGRRGSRAVVRSSEPVEEDEVEIDEEVEQVGSGEEAKEEEESGAEGVELREDYEEEVNEAQHEEEAEATPPPRGTRSSARGNRSTAKKIANVSTPTSSGGTSKARRR